MYFIRIPPFRRESILRQTLDQQIQSGLAVHRAGAAEHKYPIVCPADVDSVGSGLVRILVSKAGQAVQTRIGQGFFLELAIGVWEIGVEVGCVFLPVETIELQRSVLGSHPASRYTA